MPERVFLFVQMELPWELGPSDGRWLLRSASGEVERVVVIGTVGALRRRARRGRVRMGRSLSESPETTFPVTRATSIDPVPVSNEAQARAWLQALDAERETLAAFAVLNRLLFAHRIATADPYIHEAFPSQALAIRAGYGLGEQVADGRWIQAQEMQWMQQGMRRRVAALRPQERLAVLLGARGRALQCEEHALRARLDLDHGRLRLAAIELERAYAIGLAELAGERRPDLNERLAELQTLRPEVIEAAEATLPRAAAVAATEQGAEPDEQLLRHALERLEAALRARTATGFHDRGP